MLTDPKNLHQHRRLTVEAGCLVGLGETVDHPGHIPQEQPRAVPPIAQDDILELPTPIGLTRSPQQDLSALRADGAPGQIQGRPAHRLGHLVEGKAMALQILL